MVVVLVGWVIEGAGEFTRSFECTTVYNIVGIAILSDAHVGIPSYRYGKVLYLKEPSGQTGRQASSQGPAVSHAATNLATLHREPFSTTANAINNDRILCRIRSPLRHLMHSLTLDNNVTLLSQLRVTDAS